MTTPDPILNPFPTPEDVAAGLRGHVQATRAGVRWPRNLPGLWVRLPAGDVGHIVSVATDGRRLAWVRWSGRIGEGGPVALEDLRALSLADCDRHGDVGPGVTLPTA